MTGVEALSNGVMAFRDPATKNDRKALTVIIALLCHFYGSGATQPDSPGYQSVHSQLTSAVMGRGWFYYVTSGSILVVLALAPTPRSRISRASRAPLRSRDFCRTSSRCAGGGSSIPGGSRYWWRSPEPCSSSSAA